MSRIEAEDSIALSELQLELMQVLWRLQPVPVADVVEALSGSRGLAHTTVATLLTRLSRRGLVVAQRDGRQLLYSACVSESQVRRTMVSDIVRNLFRGNPTALLAHLLEEREVGAADLERIQALLDSSAGAAEPSADVKKTRD